MLNEYSREMSTAICHSPLAVSHFVGSRGLIWALTTGSSTHPWLSAVNPFGDSSQEAHAHSLDRIIPPLWRSISSFHRAPIHFARGSIFTASG
jgi:hypothetical protein